MAIRIIGVIANFSINRQPSSVIGHLVIGHRVMALSVQPAPNIKYLQLQTLLPVPFIHIQRVSNIQGFA